MDITLAQLWYFARAHHLEDAHIRICDGMACSFYVNDLSVGRAPGEIVIDVSHIEPIEFDDLTDTAKRVTFAVPR
jgi:hypothetical protein